MIKVKRALISVSNKDKVVELAKGLDKLGIEIISTGGTKRILEKEGIKVKAVSDCTKTAEMLSGRVKTLHPAVHAAILARRGNKQDIKELKKAEIGLIDMVVVNLYPFEEVISDPNVSLDKAIENIDIGGPTMLRAAAKNYKSVAAVSSPSQYSHILEELKINGSRLSEETSAKLASEVFKMTSFYDGQISRYLKQRVLNASKDASRDEDNLQFAKELSFSMNKIQDLRYGENPHQRAAFYRDDKISYPSLCDARQLHGKELSFNNILDLNSAIEIIKDFKKPMVCILKHNNPCGAAVADNLSEAYQLALSCDAMSAYGGIVGLNQVVDEEAAALIHKTRFIECLISLGYTENALKLLKKKKNIRILELSTLKAKGLDIDFKKVNGGLLIQEKDLLNIDTDVLKVVTKRKPVKGELESLMFAWRICKYVKSNAIVLAQGSKTVGIGAGQMSRIDAVRIAISKAGKLTENSVMASDAFFPMKDSIEYANKAKIKAVIQPGGSIRDEEVIQEANKCGIAMVFTGIRHFKH